MVELWSDLEGSGSIWKVSESLTWFCGSDGTQKLVILSSHLMWSCVNTFLARTLCCAFGKIMENYSLQVHVKSRSICSSFPSLPKSRNGYVRHQTQTCKRNDFARMAGTSIRLVTASVNFCSCLQCTETILWEWTLFWCPFSIFRRRELSQNEPVKATMSHSPWKAATETFRLLRLP